ncbi:hypothetical protein [Taibaiella soli]|uniref:Uncharacterized protein n=1 Tax=Taibaiella soli TaxID=1649169 RepID=A0A2W2BAS8_9BACT|nr:hypothetical protein [Taibaiella soli]PZF72997.1 hypothetical protein DN068_11345 [Taibaiella soli]
MNRETERSRDVARHVFSGSTTMIGVCITIIALFRVMKIGMRTYADEVLGLDNFIFIAAALCAYSAIRKDNNIRMERAADLLFFAGMAVMLVVGLIIVFSTY